MIIYFNVNDNGYLDGWGSTRSTDDEIELDLPKGHDFFNSDHQAWKYENEELIFDEERKQQLIDEYEYEQNKLSIDDINTLAIFELAQQIEELKGE